MGSIDSGDGPRGGGIFNLELWLLHVLGIDLSKNTYAFNETLRNVLRIIIPFFILVLFSLIDKRPGTSATNRFFLKMRVPVVSNRGEDERKLKEALAVPDYNKSLLLFPNSNWEFKRWNREDTIGFLISSLVVIAMLGALSKFLSA